MAQEDIADQADMLRLLREERDIAREGLEKAKRDFNRCDVNVKNAEAKFAQLVAPMLGDNGTHEMINLTQREWRKRVDAERASKAASDA